jgi:hypothetical protein
VGVAGIVTKNSRFLHFRLKGLREHFNLLRALFYTIVLNFSSSISPGELKVEALVVASEMREQGIGTKFSPKVKDEFFTTRYLKRE